jgi:hypothetical protein
MAQGEKAQGNGLTLLLLAVLGLFGIRASTTESPVSEHGKKENPASEKSAADASHAESSGSEPSDRFWQPVLEFRGPDTQEHAKISADDESPFGRLLSALRRVLATQSADPYDGLPDVNGWDTRCLIACVPHPTDSISGDYFDGLVDAIQRAVETQGYVLDRYYYPWPGNDAPGRPKTGQAGDAAASPSPSAGHDSGNAVTPERERRPGILLFRGPAEPNVECGGGEASQPAIAAGASRR